MQIFYIANMRMPTERAHGIQVVHMCSAFARKHRTDADKECGTEAEQVKVTLLVPDRETIDEDPYAYYGIERNFTIEKIPVPDIVRFGTIGFLIESLVFAWRAAGRISSYSSFHKGSGESSSRLKLGASSPIERISNPSSDLPAEASAQAGDGVLPLRKGELRSEETAIYTREELPLLFLPRRNAFYEAHQLRRSYLFQWIIKRAKGIIAITQGLKDALVQSGIAAEKLLVVHDGFDEKAFAILMDKNEARRRIGLPADKKIAMYIGGLEHWKGAEMLCRAATDLAKDNILAVIIGGTNEEIKKLQPKYPNVQFLGARPYRELPVNQRAADVLVIPNSARERISREFTSPLKLFAHMASCVPIVASRVPSLCEVLSDETAYLVPPDDPQALAEGIRAALKDPATSAQRAKKAAENVSAYSWDKRAKKILQSMLF